METSIRKHIEAIKNGDVKLEEFVSEVLERCEKVQSKYRPFITINKKPDLKKSKGKLAGIPISVKDSICTDGIQTTAGSKILEGYVPPFDATCVANARKEGGIIIGKTALDEFGFGTFSTNCAYGAPKNPHDPERACGGSSGGAGCITAAADFPHIAIAQSTGGSITAPAAFTGTVGITPTYGRVSRYGLIDYANSMDKIGVIGKEVYDAALLLSVMSGYDPLDSTSSEEKTDDLTSYVGKGIEGMRFGIPKEYVSDTTDKKVVSGFMKAVQKLEVAGAKVEETSLPLTKYAVSSYYLIAISEASTNLAKYCGLRYGMQQEIVGDFETYFSKVRTAGFGKEAKRRILLGTYARMAGYRDAYYLKALRVRAKIIKEFKSEFKKFDALIAPSMPILPPKFSEIDKLTPIQTYNMDILTIASNMAGIPSLSVPVGKADGLPIGLQIMGDHFAEGKLIQIGSSLEGR
ncbi:MAG: aspartyl/glutamyl-tRNA amidotransferase subunit A [Candidatus Micrarchaeota archaeon]|nr:aspartyl/glutamyl-tRNA amidotransferase subunit A [Candidatus Micrarchaeota archaeon]